MSAATSPGTGLAYGLTAGLRRLGQDRWRRAVLRHDLAPARRAALPAFKRRGPKPAISDGAAVAIEADLEVHRDLGGRGLPQGLGSASGSDGDIRVARKRVLRLMRENNLLSPHRCRRRGGTIPMTMIDPSLMPRSLMWAHRWRSATLARWTTAGAGSSSPSSIGTPSVSAGMSASAATASPPSADLHGACRAVWLDRGRRFEGAGLADGSRLPVADHFKPDQVLGHPAVLRLRRRARAQTNLDASRAVQSHVEGTDHP